MHHQLTFIHLTYTPPPLTSPSSNPIIEIICESINNNHNWTSANHIETFDFSEFFPKFSPFFKIEALNRGLCVWCQWRRGCGCTRRPETRFNPLPLRMCSWVRYVYLFVCVAYDFVCVACAFVCVCYVWLRMFLCVCYVWFCESENFHKVFPKINLDFDFFFAEKKFLKIKIK